MPAMPAVDTMAAEAKAMVVDGDGVAAHRRTSMVTPKMVGIPQAVAFLP